MVCLPYSLASVQKVAGVTGALFIPIFALALLLLPRTAKGRETGFRNKVPAQLALLICLALFGYLAAGKIMPKGAQPIPQPAETSATGHEQQKLL